MKNYFKQFAILFYLMLMLILPIFVFAASPAFGNLEKVGEVPLGSADAPYASADESSLASVASSVIRAFLGLLGIIFLILLIYAGYNWMTAQGEEEKVEKAKSTITRAIIGLVIITAAYSITYFVFSSLPKDGNGGSGINNPTGSSGL
ncbi:MAG: hypothetical protein V1667_00760 [bacterium]